MMLIADRIWLLELGLLHSDVRQMPHLLDHVLADDFEEIGGRGNVVSRQDVIDWLVKKNPEDRWLLTGFRVKMLSAELALAIYHAEQIVGQRSNAGKGSVRSSIWKLYVNDWKLVFHQASKII